MKRIGLFRYHDHLEICKNRLELFRYLNPEIDIYGLYGGNKDNFHATCVQLNHYFSGNYCIEGKSDLWKWKNGDLSVRNWYIDYGKNIDFDMVHIFEWDLMMTESLDKLFSHIPNNALGITGLTSLKKLENKWYWTRNSNQRTEWEALKSLLKANYNFTGPYFASVGPGLSLPKSFLNLYATVEVPEYGNDELRLPAFAAAMGFQLYDTGFVKKWNGKNEKNYFNCNEYEIPVKTVLGQLSRKNGRRVFHPFRDKIKIPDLFTQNNNACYDINLL
jgi:hypothetical protein